MRHSVKPHNTSQPLKSSPTQSQPSISSLWSLYLIISTNNPIKTYVGVTTDFSRRLKQHNGELKGGAKASRSGRPWISCSLESKWKILSHKLPRKKETDEMKEDDKEVSLALLQHRQAALNKLRGSFDFSHLDIDRKLNPS
ncbi:hypothetical protein ACHQM5_012654 [Ranunculus cassubicifolius]